MIHKMTRKTLLALAVSAAPAALAVLTGCSGGQQVAASGQPAMETAVSVGVAAVTRRTIVRQITISSELVPYQQIDLYAKESGYLKQLLVDYGTRVKKGQLVAVLEIPELEMQLQQDAAAIKNERDLITQYQHQVERVAAQVNMYELQYKRLKGVADSEKGLVAQQEVDDADDKYLAAEAQLEAAKSSVASAQSELAAAEAREQHDQVLFDYRKVYAPFDGVVTQRYANEGTLVQAGTSSSTNVLPIAQLSEDDKFRLVIPVPESYVKYIRIGDPVSVHVSSLDRNFPGKIVRFSTDVTEDTRTMHTEVDVPNPTHVLIPGMYADATVTLERKNDALSVPLQAITEQPGENTVFVVNPDNKIEIRPVQVGLESANSVEIASGLREGEKVVVSDRASLKAGTLVQPHVVDTEYRPQADQ
jgi:RND family efflux transporter MFP subunit